MTETLKKEADMLLRQIEKGIVNIPAHKALLARVRSYTSPDAGRNLKKSKRVLNHINKLN